MTLVSELTVEELQDVLRLTLKELIDEAIEERLGMMTDPDEDLELRDEVAASLDDYLKSDRRGDDADSVFSELGL